MENSRIRLIYKFVRHNLEAFIWLAALALLAFMSPESTQQTLCVWHHAGFDACPGCGLGHSISAAFHGNVLDSFRFHPLGIFAIIILTIRVFRIFIENKYLLSPKTDQYVKDL